RLRGPGSLREGRDRGRRDPTLRHTGHGHPPRGRVGAVRTFVEDVVERLRHEKNTVVHCRGGLGRTGTVAACVLVALGRHSANEAVDAVREAREGTIQTDEQEDFVRCFEESLEKEDAS
ncbi:MAG: hypothetical protein CYG60_15075, partial [Actinobacteria bacterium]